MSIAEGLLKVVQDLDLILTQCNDSLSRKYRHSVETLSKLPEAIDNIQTIDAMYPFDFDIRLDKVSQELPLYDLYYNIPPYDPLPPEYQSVEYLEVSDNTSDTPISYIDTEYIFHNGSGIEIKHKLVKYYSARWNVIAGVSKAQTDGDWIWLGYGSSSRNLRFSYGTSAGYYSSASYTDTTTTWVSKITSEGVMTLNDTVVGTATKEFTTSPNTLLLFCGRYGTSIRNSSCVRIYSCKIWEDEETNLVRDLVPCYRISDNKPGMYDRIGEKFYTNAGSGNFILGPVDF